MIRKLTGSILVCALLVTVGFAQDKDEKPWFDMENCDVCKKFAGHMHLMTKLKWDMHKIDNGFMSITVIPDDVKDEWAKVKASMDEAIANVSTNPEDATLCQHCMGYGDLMAHGAKMQELETVGGQVTLFTATDADTITMLHEFADRTIAENKKMMEAMGLGQEHGEHGGKHEHGDKDG